MLFIRISDRILFVILEILDFMVVRLCSGIVVILVGAAGEIAITNRTRTEREDANKCQCQCRCLQRVFGQPELDCEGAVFVCECVGFAIA